MNRNTLQEKNQLIRRMVEKNGKDEVESALSNDRNNQILNDVARLNARN